MGSPIRERISELLLSNKRHARYAAILACLALVVAVGVAGLLRQRGNAMTHEETVLDCQYDGSGAHTHDVDCYDADGNLVCPLEERELHIHDDSCYEETSTLVCGLEESEGHAHDDSCYDEEGNLVCELEESEGHTHDDSCYETERELVCSEEEITEEHVHGPGCFKTIEVDDGTEEDEEAEVEDEADANAEDLTPAQVFEGELRQIDDKGNEYVAMAVHVEAPEGAFPKGTTMQVDAVDEEDVKGSIDNALAQETTGKVIDLQLVDITFHDVEGAEIEPAKEITVNLASDLIARSSDPYVVHINDTGDADVVETLSDDELVDRDLPSGDDQLTFDAESFSPYGVAVTSQDETLRAEGGETYDSITVEAAAAAGVPYDAELQVHEILEGSDKYKDCLAQIQDALGEEIGYVRFYDISIVRDGEDVQPQEAVDVKIDLNNVDGLTNGVQAVHYGKDGLELLDASLSGATVAFEANGFSVYAVVAGSTDEHARMKLEFYGADLTTPIATMYVKNDDTAEELQEILYDPGAGALPEHSVFSGWILDNENYTTADVANAMNIDEIREWAETQQITEGDTHKFYAAVCKLYTITYKDDDENGTVLGKEAVPVKASEYGTAEVDYLVRMAYTPKDDMHDFEGWILDEDSVADVSSEVPDGRIYQNDTPITITGNVSFTVNAPEGHWLVFDENGKGGTYNAPQFVKSSEVTSDANLNDMVRNGYTFDGWYDTKEHADAHAANPSVTTGKFEFGQTLSDKTTIYASWVPNRTAPYTVVFWTENINRDGYDLKASYVGEGRVGQNIPYTLRDNTDEDYFIVGGSDYHYTGFCAQPVTRQVTITPEGDAVLNVYYDRIVYNLKFYYYRTSSNGTNTYATGSYAGKNVWNVANPYNWGTGTPSQTYGTEHTETVEGYTGHYFILQAYYGEDISSRWPSYSQITGPANNRAPVSFIMMNGAGLKGNGLNDNGYGDGRDTIKGLITVMDENILGKTNDINGNFLVIRFYTYNDWTYHIYYEAYEGQDLTGKTTKELNGKTFYLDHDVESRSSNTYPAQQNPPQFQGFEVVENSDGTEYYDGFGPAGTPQANTSGYEVYLNYYYNRLSYPINYMDGTYFDGNGNIIQNRQENPLHTSEDIMFDADIPQTYKDYTPTLPAGENGYVFEGWFADSACNTPYEFNKMPIGGIIVYAKWRQVEYRVFLHPNAGTDENLDWGSENVSTSFRVPYGGKVSTPTGKRAESGYEFVGWYTDPSCSSEYLYNPDTVLNDQTVTTLYDQTEDTELDKWGNVISGQEGVNSDRDGNRTWVTRKLDLYAKWRKILEGAEGISVIYNPVDDEGHVGTNPPTDETLYPDEAEATAQAASTAPGNTNMTFKCWVVQKWNETERRYEDTEITVLPGERFIVDDEYARKQEKEEEPGKYTYTMQLRAEYDAPEEGLPTHIWWFKNYTNDGAERHNAIHQDEGISINEGVAIQPAPVRQGYTFLGWARVDDVLSESLPGAPIPATANVLELDEDDVYLKYENGRFTLNDPDSAYNGRVVTEVAADERRPYHDMYAVWKKNIEVYLKKVDKDTPSKQLSGAKFRLLHKDDGGEYADDITSITNPITVDGRLVIFDLPSGDYKLIETESPAGYIIQTNEIFFTVNTTYNDRAIITPTTGEASYETIGAYTETAEFTSDTLVIPNETGKALPMTGGPGTNLFTITGTALIVGALMYGSVSRRRNERRSMG